MDLKRIYQMLSKLDADEEIGYAYYRQTGKNLDFFDMNRIKLHAPSGAKDFDFSYLESEEAVHSRAEMEAYINRTGADLLHEQNHIAKNCNVELNYVPQDLDIPPHQHDFFEIVYTLRGKCGHRIETQTIEMQTGDIVIIPPHIEHFVFSLPKSRSVNIKIRKSTFDRVFINLLQNKTVLSDYFAQTLYSQNYQNSLTFHCGDDAFLLELLLYMYAQQEENKPYANHVIDGLITTFFSYLIQNYEESVKISSANTGLNQRMVEIKSYIHLKYATTSLKQTAEHFYLSEPYLSSLIKQQTGQSFSDMLRQIRMQHARDLLLRTNMKIDDICESVGYRDTTQFIRTFKAIYGTTPKQYQKKQGKNLD